MDNLLMFKMMINGKNFLNIRKEEISKKVYLIRAYLDEIQALHNLPTLMIKNFIIKNK